MTFALPTSLDLKRGSAAQAPAPGFAGGASFRGGEEMLERDVEEGGAGLGEHSASVVEVAVDVQAPPADARQPGGDRQLGVDRNRPAIAHEDARGDRGKAVPGGEEPARLVEGGSDESAVNEPGTALVPLVERERRLVPLETLGLGRRQADPVGVGAAAPARGVVVWRNLHAFVAVPGTEAGRGRRTSSPPQFGQTWLISTAHDAQKVHSNVQM